MKVTRRFLDALKKENGGEHGTRFQDDDLAGFFVSHYASGRIAFGVRFRANGVRRELRLGDFPAVMPEDARKLALAVLGDAAKGEDAAEKKKAARAGATAKQGRITFKTWRGLYVEDAARRLKSTRDPERYLRLAGESGWDSRALADIGPRDVEIFRNRFASKGKIQANRWLANVASSFTHAMRLGHVERNPCALVPRLPENLPRSRVMTADEEARLRAALAGWPNPFEKIAVALLLDCGARLSEVLHAKWEDFDLDEETHAGTWKIPAPKSGRPQSVPVLAHVGALVLKTPRLVDAPFVVVGRVASVARRDLARPWKRLRTAAKLGADVHIHDLRRSFGLRVTRSQGIFAASKLLRHSNSKITESVYAPLSAEDVRGFAEGTETARLLAFTLKRKASKK
jgi:integrase